MAAPDVFSSPEVVEFDFRIGEECLRLPGKSLSLHFRGHRLQLRIVPLNLCQHLIDRVLTEAKDGSLYGDNY